LQTGYVGHSLLDQPSKGENEGGRHRLRQKCYYNIWAGARAGLVLDAATRD